MTNSLNRSNAPTSEAFRAIQSWLGNLDRRLYAMLIGVIIGGSAGLIALGMAIAGPVITLGAMIGLLAGLYILTDVRIALFGIIAIIMLIPFGTLPFRLGLTPTLLEVALGAFLLVYLFQWMTGKRTRIQLTPVHGLITLYLMWLIFAFALGLRWAMPTAAIMRDFSVMILLVGLSFVLVDLIRDPAMLRRIVLVIVVFVTLQGLVAITLFLLPDTLAENLLVRLSRIGYPNGGVIRYIESNPELGERAIGTWVDPNALGSIFATGSVIIATQVFAIRPVLKARWLTVICLLITVIGLMLTSSRASFLALGAGLSVIAFLKYRRFIPILLIASSSLLLLPQTQEYVDRIFQALRGEDLATQMRIGEWTDSLNLISDYPFAGIGFTGSPQLGLYTDVANMYLIMGNKIGVTGVIIFLVAMLGVFVYGRRAWRYSRDDMNLDSIHLGFNVALMTALVNAVADLYYFRFDFQSSIAWFWIIVALALASSRLVLQTATNADKPTVEKAPSLR